MNNLIQCFFILTIVSWGMFSSATEQLTSLEILDYASRPFSESEIKDFELGQLNGQSVKVEFICSDLCPAYTVRIIRYELNADETCAEIGGIEKSVVIPAGIAAGPKIYCFPEVLVENWSKYQRKLESVK